MKENFMLVCKGCETEIYIDSNAFIYESSVEFDWAGTPKAWFNIKCPKCGNFHFIEIPVAFYSNAVEYI